MCTVRNCGLVLVDKPKICRQLAAHEDEISTAPITALAMVSAHVLPGGTPGARAATGECHEKSSLSNRRTVPVAFNVETSIDDAAGLFVARD